MRGAIIFCLLFGASLARPDGNYHEQYQYKTSSSSYKNNELKHKNDDEGFYSRQGDLEGKIEPKINSYSQQSEYKNPKFYQGTTNQAQTNDFYLQQTRGIGYDSNNQQTGTTGVHLYPTGQLDVLTQQLQNDLTRQLQYLIQEQQQKYRTSSSYSNQGLSGLEYQLTEQQLRHNLTRLVDDALYRQYGQHGYNSQQNKDQIQLLRQQIETKLAKQIQDGLSTHSIQGSQTSSSSSFTSSGTTYGTTGYQHPTDNRPIHLTPTSHNTNSFSQYNTQHVTPGSVPLSDITRLVEIDIIKKVSDAVYDKINKYRHIYGRNPFPNYQNELEYLTNDLMRNVTNEINNQLTRYYGRQEKRGSYYYTITGTTNTIPNYRDDEYSASITQLQNNLIRNLQETFRQQYNQYNPSSSTSHGTSNQYHYQQGATHASGTYPSSQISTHQTSGSYPTHHGTTHQTGTVYPTSHVTTHQTGTTYPGSHVSTHQTYPGSHVSTHQTYPTSHVTTHPTSHGTTSQQIIPSIFIIGNEVPAELRVAMQNAHNNLAHDLQVELLALQKRYSQSFRPDYQALKQQLENELRRNVTRLVQQSIDRQYGQQVQRGSNFYTTNAANTYNTAPNYNAQQFHDIVQQLQDTLVQNLQVGLTLQQSNSHSTSSSSSSSSSSSAYVKGGSYTSGSYMPTHGTVGFQKYPQFSSSCSECDGMQADDSFHRSNLEQQEQLPQLQQTIDDSLEDLTQQTQDKYEKIQIGHQQQIEDDFAQQFMDNTQQIEDKNKKYSLDGQQVIQTYQQAKDDDDTQQQSEDKYGKLLVGQQQEVEDKYDGLLIGQEQQQQQQQVLAEYNLGNTQQVDNYDSFSIGQQQQQQQQQQLNIEQQISGDTQQIEDKYDNLMLGGQTQQQLVDDGQQIEEKNEKLVFTGQQQDLLGTDDQQQTEDKYEKFIIGEQQREDQTQQVEDGYGKLQVGQHTIHVQEKLTKLNPDDTQQVDMDGQQLIIGGQQQESLEFNEQQQTRNQQTENKHDRFVTDQQENDQTQQLETGYGTLTIGSRHKYEHNHGKHHEHDHHGHDNRYHDHRHGQNSEETREIRTHHLRHHVRQGETRLYDQHFPDKYNPEEHQQIETLNSQLMEDLNARVQQNRRLESSLQQIEQENDQLMGTLNQKVQRQHGQEQVEYTDGFGEQSRTTYFGKIRKTNDDLDQQQVEGHVSGNLNHHSHHYDHHHTRDHSSSSHSSYSRGY